MEKVLRRLLPTLFLFNVIAVVADTATAPQQLVDIEGKSDKEKLLDIINSPRLPSAESVPLLLEFAGSAMESGDPYTAMDYYQRAQHALHREYGVRSMEQEEVLNLMINASLKYNDVSMANKLVEYRHALYVHNFGNDHVKTAVSEVQVADWYQMTTQFRDAKAAYLGALEKFKALPNTEAHQARILFSLAHNTFLEGLCCVETFADQALETLKDTNIDPIELSRVALEAADLKNVTNHAKSANTLYREAGAIFNAGESEAEYLGISGIDRMSKMYQGFLPTAGSRRYSVQSTRNLSNNISPGKLIGNPIPMCEAQFTKVARHKDYDQYYMVIELTVGEDGEPQNIAINDSNAPLRVKHLMKNMVSLSRFRPAFNEAGEPVASTVTINQRFDESVDLIPSDHIFPVSNLAVFQGCHEVAMTLDKDFLDR